MTSDVTSTELSSSTTPAMRDRRAFSWNHLEKALK